MSDTESACPLCMSPARAVRNPIAETPGHAAESIECYHEWHDDKVAALIERLEPAALYDWPKVAGADVTETIDALRTLRARLDAAHEAIRYVGEEGAPDLGATGAWVDEYDAAWEGHDR